MSSVATLETEEPGFSLIGRRVPKYDATQKVTGHADYMLDLKLPGMLHGKILRSRYPHARITKIDTSKAKSLSGVVAVITSADTPRIRFGFMKDNIPLKDGKVLSYRDEVAAVAAVDEETAARAIELIDVEYEELPPIFDPLEAMKDGAPRLHDECERNIVKLPFRFMHGGTEGMFSGKEVVSVEDTFRLHFITHAALGTMGVVASSGPDGRLTMWSNTQAPFMYQRELAGALGIPAEKVRVIQPYIGGSFGRGMDVYPVDCIAALLSTKTGSPVKIVFSREEDLGNSPTRQPAVIKVRTSASRDGKLLARRVMGFLDVGAYVSGGAFDARVMMATSTGQ
jgi:xanthine dehydrogenase molybdenum-binding subunit